MFSIIIRVKNEERWIGHTIQSVLDFIPENEIIIVDNNSSDRSIEIANTFKKNNNLNSEGSKYTSINILNIDEYTPGKSLNYGVSQAKFENILVISSHCVLKKFNLNSVLERLMNYPAILENKHQFMMEKELHQDISGVILMMRRQKICFLSLKIDYFFIMRCQFLKKNY